MSSFELLKLLHISLVLISGAGFALRGFIRLVLRRRLANPLVRFGPHLIDTLLLFSGIGLWWLTAYSPLTSGWFGLKLVLILAYIVIGIRAFRVASERSAVIHYVIALMVFLSIAWLALVKPI